MDDKRENTQLEDIMVAMDVVDTLRHNEKLVSRELDQEGRRERLIKRLREIYQAQGVSVTDEILMEGVLALEEKRFSYVPAKKSYSSKIAKIYVKRDVWLKPLLLLVGAVIFITLLYYFSFVRPGLIEHKELPGKIEKMHNAIVALSTDKSATAKSHSFYNAAMNAIASGETGNGAKIYEKLNHLHKSLQKEYTIRIVSKTGKRSGVWRVPDINSGVRNYYLIVEAIDDSGNVVPVSILNEENNKNVTVSTWGMRVPFIEFKRVQQDKMDDGIIQNNIIGEKKKGFLEPNYTIATAGGEITEW